MIGSRVRWVDPDQAQKKKAKNKEKTKEKRHLSIYETLRLINGIELRKFSKPPL
jgi:hypothetical protein